MKNADIVLYAVVIGKKGRHTRYVTTKHLKSDELAVYEEYSKANYQRKLLLKTSTHKNIYVIRLQNKP